MNAAKTAAIIGAILVVGAVVWFSRADDSSISPTATKSSCDDNLDGVESKIAMNKRRTIQNGLRLRQLEAERNSSNPEKDVESNSDDDMSLDDEREKNNEQGAEFDIEKAKEKRTQMRQALDDIAEQEPRDVTWAESYENTVKDAIMTNFPDTELSNIACGTRLCKMEINHSSEEKGNDFLDRFGFEIEAEATRWDVELNEKGEMTTTMYIVRRGTDMKELIRDTQQAVPHT